MTNRKLKTSVALLALSGCATEGTSTVESSDGRPADARGPKRGPGAQLDAGIFLPADAAATGEVTGSGDAAAPNDVLAIGSDAVVSGTDSVPAPSDAWVSDLLIITVCTTLSLAGCDGGIGPAEVPPDLTDAGVKKDARPAVALCPIPSPTGDGLHPATWRTVSNPEDSRYLCEHTLHRDSRIESCNNGDITHCPLATPEQCLDVAHDFTDASGRDHSCFVTDKNCPWLGGTNGAVCQIVGMASSTVLVGGWTNAMWSNAQALCSSEGKFVGWRCGEAMNAWPLL
jgi:hypothetical protein